MVRPFTPAFVALAALVAATVPAHADLQICSRMSYVVEATFALEDKGTATTRGWYRVDPGQCRTVLQGAFTAETLYIHARALPVYGGSPLPQQMANSGSCGSPWFQNQRRHTPTLLMHWQVRRTGICCHGRYGN